jgi:circadian clock protein KaiC
VADSSLTRLPTGIGGLDEILGGGLIRGDAYLVRGWPGSGKTTFGNQLAYNHARDGGRAVFATLLAEPHDRMLAHLRSFSFYDPEQVAERLRYLSIYEPIARDGLDAGLDLLRREVRAQRVTLLVIDGTGLLEDLAPSRLELRRFAHTLQAQLGMLGCTPMLLVNPGDEGAHPLEPHVDGVLRLENRGLGARDLRFLRVAKLRGSAHAGGAHAFAIAAGGIEVYPRLEATQTPSPVPAGPRPRLAFGVAGFDDMLRGGVPVGSTTLVLGSPGAGKTLSGLHFVVEGARRGEPGLVATFQESPPELVAKAAGVGLDLGRHVDAGLVRILWQPAAEQLPDAWARGLLALVAEHRPRRLSLESLAELERLLHFAPERLAPFLTALVRRLSAAGVTTLLSAEVGTVVGQEVRVPTLSAAVDNAVLLRYVELRSHLHRLLSIIKVRDSAFDASIREFVISGRGLEVAATFESAEAVLTGAARALPSSGRGGAVEP